MVNRRALVFWGSAAAVAVGVAVLGAVFPWGIIGLESAAEHERAWLLTLWTGGVFGILFGLSSMLGAFSGIGVRGLAEAESLAEAVEEHRRSRRRGEEFHRSFAWWIVVTGALLVGAYFIVWLILK